MYEHGKLGISVNTSPIMALLEVESSKNLLYTGVSNVDQGSWIEPSDSMVEMIWGVSRLIKNINSKYLNQGIFL